MRCETEQRAKRIPASERREKFKGTELGGLRAEVRGRADRQHDDCPEHQNAEARSGVQETRLYRPRTRRHIDWRYKLDCRCHFRLSFGAKSEQNLEVLTKEIRVRKTVEFCSNIVEC
jgi:hypothetical protein